MIFYHKSKTLPLGFQLRFSKGATVLLVVKDKKNVFSNKQNPHLLCNWHNLLCIYSIRSLLYLGCLNHFAYLVEIVFFLRDDLIYLQLQQ